MCAAATDVGAWRADSSRSLIREIGTIRSASEKKYTALDLDRRPERHRDLRVQHDGVEERDARPHGIHRHQRASVRVCPRDRPASVHLASSSASSDQRYFSGCQRAAHA